MRANHAPAIECVLTSDEVRLLAAIGFMAARSGLVVPAIRIFEALSVLRPRAAFPFVGLAFSHLCIGANEAAETMLRERALKLFPDEPEIHACLALALQDSGRSVDAEKIVRRLNRYIDEGRETPLVTCVSARLSGEHPRNRPQPLIHKRSERRR